MYPAVMTTVGRWLWESKDGTQTLREVPVRDIAALHADLPAFQRAEDEQHTDLIYGALTQHYVDTGTVSLPGVLTLGCVTARGPGNSLMVVDGQHRVKALSKFVGVHPDAGSHTVLVSVHTVPDTTALYALYRAVNSSRPVDVKLNAPDAEKWAVLERWMRQTFSGFIRSTDRPRVPYFNPVTWIQDGKRVTPAGCLDSVSPDALVIAVSAWNLHMATLLDVCDPHCKDGLWCCFSGFRHGEWMMRVVEHAVRGVPYRDMVHTKANARPRVPRAVRVQVWIKRNGPESRIGSCFTCKDPSLTYDSFECGHVTSFCLGGPTTVDNLEPICAMCNRDMGIMNLFEYKALIES